MLGGDEEEVWLRRIEACTKRVNLQIWCREEVARWFRTEAARAGMKYERFLIELLRLWHRFGRERLRVRGF